MSDIREIRPNSDEDGRLLGWQDALQEEAAEFVERRDLRAPFPWFGGKSRVAHLVWDRFGDCANYVEPFAGSLAVLLSRPHRQQTETVNDLDCYLANFWRSLANAPAAVAEAADWPVNEADLHARHLWLVNQLEFRERMKTDPEFYDPKIAGWWVWGISQWIGSGWCSRPDWSGRTNAGRAARGVHTTLGNTGMGVNRKIPHLGNTGMGVNRKIPHLGNTGMGVNRKIPHLGDAGMGGDPADSAPGGCGPAQKRPMLSGRGQGVGVHADRVAEQRPYLGGNKQVGMGINGKRIRSGLLDYFEGLAYRLRRVRVCCGDWTRVTGPSVTLKHGVTGIFLDPPYDMRVVSNGSSGRDGAAPSDGLYSEHSNDVLAAVRAWALENGDNPLLRIALCGYQDEHEMPRSWECVAWKAHGGYGSQRGDHGYENATRERIWFSPACLKPPTLWTLESA